MLPYNKYIKSLSEAPDKLSKLRLDADMDDFIRQAVMDESLKATRRRARDLAEGLNSDPMISVIEEAMKAKYKFTMPELLDGGESFKAKAVAEAVASGDINKIIEVYPLVKDNEMAKAAIEEMVAKTKDPGKAFALEKSLKKNPHDIDMLEIDQDARLNEALDKLAGRREVIDEASVGGFSNDAVPELTGMRVVDDQMFGDELFDMKLRDRTRHNRAYDSSPDKFINQEGVDISGTNRYRLMLLEEMTRKAKEQQSVDLMDRLKTRRSLHKDPLMRDKLDERNSLSVNDIEKYKQRGPGKSEAFLQELRSAYRDRLARYPKNRKSKYVQHQIMEDIANEWIPQGKGFDIITAPKDVHPGNPRGNAKISDSKMLSELERAEARRNSLMERIEKKRSIGDYEGADIVQEQLDNINDKIIELKDKEKMIADASENREAEMIANQWKEARELDWTDPKEISRDVGEETLYLDDILSGKAEIKDDRSLRKRRKMLEEAAGRIKGEGRNVSVRRFTPSGKPAGYTNVREKQLLREMYPVNKKQKVDKDLGQSGMNVSKWDKPATREFITGISKQNGFRFSEQMIDRMLRMTKQQVIDFIDNISNP